ncbi:Uma2 family endonuclease [Paludisphaera mucosa]|uniref:Uma2 family endonuclease n=1 Tax=Paludisphaera mucosa TaxID=3030827 RepID=A0ABT6FC08_9BACT|nr:Uma2 family endonuclease [Paludisphaera mucosa]MDG3004933.1 Uma2 family endonuclease [Paludisphaera mucosa]
MSTSALTPRSDSLLYPDSDGQPMSDDTVQFRWIVLIKEGLEFLFRDRPDVFVAGDLLWYFQEGDPKSRTAPDVMVVFGRSKGDRGSYKQWAEGGIAPQVVFEILSPGNRVFEMNRKFRIYDDCGVEEYYIYDPDDGVLQGWLHEGGRLREIPDLKGWVSPRLGVRFEPGEESESLTIRHPDGSPFRTALEMQEAAEAERLRAEAAEGRAEAARLRAERLAARLRELGESVD